MSHAHHRSSNSKRPLRLGLLALVLVPLLLILQVPMLAALVPGALITVASIDAMQDRERHALPQAELVTLEDRADHPRIAAATSIEARHRRVHTR